MFEDNQDDNPQLFEGGPSPGQGLDLMDFGLQTAFAKGEAPWVSGLLTGIPSVGKKGPGILLKQGMKGLGAMKGAALLYAPMLMLDVGLSASMAPRHHMGSRVAGAIAGSTAAMVGATIGSFFGGPLGSAVGGLIGDQLVRGPVSRAVYFAERAGQDRNKLHFGGNYHDTQIAYTMRQRAAMEIGNSLMNARQYLGKEALMMHD